MSVLTQGLLRTDFNSSGLIRLLARLVGDQGATDAAGTKRSFAERLGLWLDYLDAISLSAALNSGAAGGPEALSVSPSFARVPLREEFARVRAGLLDSINATAVPKAGPAPGATAASATDFSPFRRYYLARQRDMEADIGPLRAAARAALAARSPALKRLAAVDAALDKALGERERSLLASLPALLEKRFEHLRKGHEAAPGTPAASETTQPGGWLAVFRQDMHEMLLAELDLRLQPVSGLIEALGNEVTTQQ